MEHDEEIGDKPTEYLRGVLDCAGYFERLFDLKASSDEVREKIEKICEDVQGVLVTRFTDGLDLTSRKSSLSTMDGTAVGGNAKEPTQ